jgi:mannose-1-phosphate guanylyltransferase
MQALLLAAGFGTRLRPYTLVRPKPLFPICNVPLLHILLEKLTTVGCKKIVVNSHHLADQIAAAVIDRPGVILQHEPEILGTGGSLRQAVEHFTDGPVLVMNGDIYHDIDLCRLFEAHVAGSSAVTMALHNYPRFNTVRGRNDRVCGFGKAEAAESLLAFTGIHVLNREVIEQIPANGFFHIIDLYEQLALAGQISFVRVDGSFWQDIGTPADYLDLHRRLLEEKTSAWVISKQADVGKNVEFSDWGAVESNAVIGSGAQLTRCVVWKNAIITPGEQLTDRIIC